MWFLEHESLFGGKRIWLRPGSQQLFGRTKSTDKDGAEGKTWKIENRAVSRQHVMLKVLEVSPHDGTKLHARSQVEITDLSCRQGTTIDEKTVLRSNKADDGTLVYDKSILTGTEHTIRLAQGFAPFKIVWKPYVFTYAAKETEQARARNAKLHAIDIKTTPDFIFGKTTHVVSLKRNLPKVLSGLVSAKYIVCSDFLDAVINAAAISTDEEGGYVPSKLEEDFDTWWPKEKEHITPVGTEPTPRPQEMLEPDESRSEVFSGLTFVFLDRSLYENLQEPISGGGGKALIFDLQPGVTTIQEYVDYVQSVAGQKKRNAKNTDKLPVITIRLQSIPDGVDDWASTFSRGTDRALNQRSILQNEFLDAIITKDRTLLQQPPTEVAEVSSSAPASAPTRRSMRERTPASQSRAPSEAPESSAPPEGESVRPNPRKRAHRAKTASRFTGFDDYEPPPKIRKVENTPMEDVQPSVQEVEHIPSSQTVPPSQTRSATSPQTHVVAKEEQLDTLFPAAAEMRRRRAATRAPSASVEPEEIDDSVQKSRSKGAEALERLQRAKANASKDINIREETRLRVKEEEERRLADREALELALEGIDISEAKNLAQIEEMEVIPREHRPSTRVHSQQADNPRWNPEWNGRKNFKRFRRRGVEQGVQPRKVIVELEEAPTESEAVEDPFFLKDVDSSSRSVASRRRQQTVDVDNDDDSSDPEPGFTRRKPSTQPESGSMRRKPSTQLEVIAVEDSGSDDEDVVVARTQRSSGRTQRIVETQMSDASGQKSGKKRPPVSSSGQPASKRGKITVRDDSDDNDDEEVGFRFKRRG
jgi:hypothetical protein